MSTCAAPAAAFGSAPRLLRGHLHRFWPALPNGPSASGSGRDGRSQPRHVARAAPIAFRQRLGHAGRRLATRSRTHRRSVPDVSTSSHENRWPSSPALPPYRFRAMRARAPARAPALRQRDRRRSRRVDRSEPPPIDRTPAGSGEPCLPRSTASLRSPLQPHTTILRPSRVWSEAVLLGSPACASAVTCIPIPIPVRPSRRSAAIPHPPRVPAGRDRRFQNVFLASPRSSGRRGSGSRGHDQPRALALLRRGNEKSFCARRCLNIFAPSGRSSAGRAVRPSAGVRSTCPDCDPHVPLAPASGLLCESRVAGSRPPRAAQPRVRPTTARAASRARRDGRRAVDRISIRRVRSRPIAATRPTRRRARAAPATSLTIGTPPARSSPARRRQCARLSIQLHPVPVNCKLTSGSPSCTTCRPVRAAGRQRVAQLAERRHLAIPRSLSPNRIR